LKELDRGTVKPQGPDTMKTNEINSQMTKTKKQIKLQAKTSQDPSGSRLKQH
jgi:hypothetical protein